MSRSTPEWVEENHDKPIPDKVRRLVIRRADGICNNCRVRVRVGSGHIDHIVALCNGGEHLHLLKQFYPLHSLLVKNDMITTITVNRNSKAPKQRKRGQQVAPKRNQSSLYVSLIFQPYAAKAIPHSALKQR